MAWISLRDSQYISLVANQGFDAVLLDMQHGLHDEASTIAGIEAIIKAGKSPLVRIPVGRYDTAQRVLDFGALGVVAPMINNRAEAELFAQSMKYPPIGSRSFSPSQACRVFGVDMPDYVTTINKNSFALAMIETVEAYDNLDGILAVDGIDGVFVGPSDLSISASGHPVPDPYGEATIDMIGDIAKRVLAAGKIPSCFTANAKSAKLVRSLGYRLISVGTDESYITKGIDLHLDPLDKDQN